MTLQDSNEFGSSSLGSIFIRFLLTFDRSMIKQVLQFALIGKAVSFFILSKLDLYRCIPTLALRWQYWSRVRFLPMSFFYTIAVEYSKYCFGCA